MRVFYIILVLLVAIVAVVFALQNTAAITVSFFTWSVSASLSLLLIVTLALGFILAILMMAPSLFKRGWLTSGLKRKVASLEREKAAQGKKDAVTAAAAVASEAAAKVEEASSANSNTGND